MPSKKDSYSQHAKGDEYITCARLKAMGTNGFQEPANRFSSDQIQGSKYLYADSNFSTKDGKAFFMAAPWRALQAAGKAEQKANRMPYPFIKMNPNDMKELGFGAGNLVEVYNEAEST